MRAVLVAAGRGTRLGALTESTPKPLLEVAGRPILVRILDALHAAGLRDVAIITGYRGEMIRSELGNGAAVGMHIEYREQTELDGTARALSLARDFVGNEPFAFGWGDIVMRPENYRSVVRAARLADGALAVNAMDDLSQGGAVLVRNEGDMLFATGLVEKPAPGPSRRRGTTPDSAFWRPRFGITSKRSNPLPTANTCSRPRSDRGWRRVLACERSQSTGRGSISARRKAWKQRVRRLGALRERPAVATRI